MATPTPRSRGDDAGSRSAWTGQALGGGKTISYFAGIALLINNITGPGVPSLPNMFAEAGWLFPTVLFVVVCIMSSLSTNMFCEAMRKVPGNDNFRGRIEYTTVIRHFFGDRMYYAANVGLCGALQSLNIISVIQSAQVMDNAISAIWGKSCGLNISPFSNDGSGSSNGTLPGSTDVWSCIDTNDIPPNAWGCHIVVSLGFLVAMCLAIPAGYFNLDDNMVIQVVAFVLTIGCWIIWITACFFSDEFHHGTPSIPAVAQNPPNVKQKWASQAGVVGTILFNFGFVTTVPSWVNEKRPHVSVNKTVWISTWCCNLIFFLISIPGAMAFQKILSGPATGACAGSSDGSFGSHSVVGSDGAGTTDCAGDMMAVFTGAWSPHSIRSHSAWNFVVQFSVYLFPVVAVISSIPVFSIVIKYNCIENGWSPVSAFVWGVLFPWIIAVPLLYQPNALLQFINYSSLIFVSFTDFIVPWCLYIVLLKHDVYAPVAKSEQQAIRTPPPTTTLFDGKDAVGVTTKGVQDPEGGESTWDRVVEHFAIPPEWGLSDKLKTRIAVVLVLCMTGLSLYGTISSIQQGADNDWTCADVNDQ